MNISDEAVEAAAKVIALSTGSIMESDWEWERLPKERYYQTARAALEAAAPHLIAEALVEASGLVMGVDKYPADSDTCRHIADQLQIRAESLKRTNPYGSAGVRE